MDSKAIPLEHCGIEPPAQMLETKWINVNGRREHESILKNSEKCKELGLDQYYEIMVYLKRWGSWIDSPPNAMAPESLWV